MQLKTSLKKIKISSKEDKKMKNNTLPNLIWKTVPMLMKLQFTKTLKLNILEK